MSGDPKEVKRELIEVAGTVVGAPAGIPGALIGKKVGQEVGVSVLGPAQKAAKTALTREPTEEELKDKRAKARREEEIKLMQERPGKTQTALTDLTSQSAFPFRLY